MSREACRWLKAGESTGPVRRATVWDPAKNRWVKAVGTDGQPRMERPPPVGYHGIDITSLRPMRLTDRSVYVLKGNGDEVWLPMTPAAAAAATDQDRDNMRRECNAKGWIMAGHCPIRDIHSGLRRVTLIAAENQGATMCGEHEIGVDGDGRPMPPCTHYLAEKAARIAAARSVRDKEVAAERNDADKNLQAAQATAASLAEVAVALREQTAARDAAASAPQDKGKR